jgi:membrane protease YdiL (CAAX protease family)
MPAPPETRAWLRPELLRSWTEFLFVAALLIAYPVRNSTWGALHGSSREFILLLLNNHHMLWSIFVESLALAAFFFYLSWRGWRPADFKIGLGWGTSAQGVALLFLAWGGSIVAVFTFVFAAFHLQTAHPNFLSFLTASMPALGTADFHLNWLLMFAAMIINAFAEELIFMGYIFNQIAARRSPAIALPATIFLRLACHTYQDPIHLAGIGVLFTIFAVWYWFGRRLWPLILAHILLDTTSFSLILLLAHLRRHLGVALVYFY